MRKLHLAALAFAMAALIAPACGAGEKVPVLRVGTMPNAIGLPLIQAKEAGYFDEAGLNVEIIVFATGAPINEAIAAAVIDAAVTGPAAVYAMATGRYTYIGDGILTLGGETLYARPDSKFAKGEVPGMPKVVGNAAAFKGASVLGPLATTSHLTAIKYAEALGLTADDFNMVSMDRAQALQAFLTGEGDIIATCPPWSNQLDEQGYVLLTDMVDVTGGPMVEVVMARNDIVRDRRADLVNLLDCYYRACEDLTGDTAHRKQLGMRWYAEEGRTYSDADAEAEIQQKAYHTYKTLLSPEYPFGQKMVDLGAFFTGQGMIEEDMLPNVAKCIDPTLAQEAKARHVK